MAGPFSLRAKQYCDKLFELASQFSDLTANERCLKRQLTTPLMEDFYRWLKSQHVSTKSAFGSAVNYFITQQKYLARYLLDGRLQISNNRVEHGIKPFVVGRKNFLFANTACGAKASAVMYSLVETAPKRTGSTLMTNWFGVHAPDMEPSRNPNMAEQSLPMHFKATGRHI